MDTTEQPSRVLVVGAGTMGHSIAQVFAQAGITVDLADTNAEVLEAAVRRIAANLSTVKEAEHSSGAEPTTSIEKRAARMSLNQNVFCLWRRHPEKNARGKKWGTKCQENTNSPGAGA